MLSGMDSTPSREPPDDLNRRLAELNQIGVALSQEKDLNRLLELRDEVLGALDREAPGHLAVLDHDISPTPGQARPVDQRPADHRQVVGGHASGHTTDWSSL